MLLLPAVKSGGLAPGINSGKLLPPLTLRSGASNLAGTRLRRTRPRRKGTISRNPFAGFGAPAAAAFTKSIVLPASWRAAPADRERPAGQRHQARRVLLP
ncbi:MAG: hypothetical protein DU429_08345 [Candidatus Tokpelaia sp.]|nr:MAG: hypothetical protein DU430_08245 [Candidatus Tokpelaia sp.]KAA6205298.1 MAG: hypothetical protein DU429_08345 [Candidatus Tokpelaia sp.]